MHTNFLERAMTLLCFLSAVMLLSSLSATAWSATTTINPSQDNTMSGTLPDNSSGACDSIFSGMTDEEVILPLVPARRALLQFDIAGAIPPGSTINSVTLGMIVTRGENHADSTYTLHRVTTAWGEGSNGCGVKGGAQGEPAVAGAATWISAMHDQAPAWGTPGGDYIATASGSTLVNDTAPVWHSTPTLVSDVQDWLDGTTPNYGWVLIGDEANPTTARRFDSREGISKPALVVDFTPDGPVEACCESDGDCSLTVPGQCSDIPLPGVDSCEPNQCPQPTGACCNLDETCSDTVDRLVCENAGGIFQGGSSTCSQGNVDCGLTPFIEALPIPPVLAPTGTRPDGVPQYTISVETATQSVHPELPATDLWTYNGAWPSSTIVAVKGQPIEVTYVNNLPAGGGGKRGNNILEVDTCAHGPNYYGDSKRVVTHLHGGHVPARVDGQPEYHILPGETDIYEYPNNQEAGTVWYHDHALGITRLNVYGGMAGFYLIADQEDTLGPGNAFGFPSGQYEIGLAIQDRQFNPDGSLFYKAQLEDAFKGDKLLVNGKVWPFLNVDQGKYRFRTLNGSQSRDYSLRLENITDPGNDPRFILVGTDLGLIDAPIDLGNETGMQAPAERLDVVVDFEGFPAGTEIILRNDELTPPLLPNVMKFIVTDQPGYTGAVSSTLRPVPPMDESTADFTRYFRLKKETNQECKDGSGRFINEWLVESLDGPNGNVIGKHWDDLSDFPILGNREVWVFENPTNSMHPMHVHLVRFQILSKTDLNTGQPIPLEPWEINTWKDIVRIPANASARIIMDFEDYPGRFPQHCHILDHEDHEMMRQFQTSYDPAICDNDGSCDPGEDCQSCPNDCAQVSGALCGNGLCEGGDSENFTTCPADCAGKQTGSASKQFSCGYDDGQVTNPIGCGVDVNDDRCIDASSDLFCRTTPRLSACCGDKLCEGAETIVSCTNDCDPAACTPTEPGAEYSCSDGQDNDCDGLVDAADPDCLDSDGDGLTDAYEINILGTNPNNIDSDGDGLVDGNDGVVLAGTGDVDANGDGFVDGEQTTGTDPNNKDSDGDLLEDGLEVAYGANPLDPTSWPNIADGDCAPYDAPNNQLDGGDLVVAMRLALGLEATRALELAHCDLGTPDGAINVADVLLLIQMIQSQ
ncbi:MAG: multicopper oxidase domain-containing protein [Pseudomonadota bacterium]